jgi:hypothetical protein
MKLRKITMFAAGCSLMFLGAAPITHAAGYTIMQTESCDTSVAKKNATPTYYGTGFLSQANPVNPLNLVPHQNLDCANAASGMQSKVDRDLYATIVEQRRTGSATPTNVKIAEQEATAGNLALRDGHNGTALRHFSAAEQNLHNS